jgi:hypothetical protein
VKWELVAGGSGRGRGDVSVERGSAAVAVGCGRGVQSVNTVDVFSKT